MAYTHILLLNAAEYIWLLFLLLEAKGQQLQGCLVPYQRHEAKIVPYEPVSYTWGDEDPTCKIRLANGTEVSSSPSRIICLDRDGFRSFKIRPNLRSALLRFREKSMFVALWIDAICIDQNNNHEKALQVRHMDQVYRGRSLQIWLGERSSNSDLVFEMIKGCGKLFRKHGRKQGNVRWQTSRLNDHDHWLAIWDLLGRPWFSRRWIVQECVLSSDKRVFIGEQFISWRSLGDLMYFSSEPWHPWNKRSDLPERQREDNVCRAACVAGGAENSKNPILVPLPLTLDRGRAFRSLFSACIAASDKTGEMEAYTALHLRASSALTLEALLERFGAYFSQDARDGVYAFVSMASDIDASEWEPNYGSDNSASDVYEKAVGHIIRRWGSIDLICRPVLEVPGLTASTWIPCFGPSKLNCSNHTHTVSGYRESSLTTFGQPSWNQTSKVYHASGREEYTLFGPEVRHRPDGKLRYFHGKGWVVDKIEVIGRPVLALRRKANQQGFYFPEEWNSMLGLNG